MVVYVVRKLPSLPLLLGLNVDAVVGVGGGRGLILSEMKLTLTVNVQNGRGSLDIEILVSSPLL